MALLRWTEQPFHFRTAHRAGKSSRPQTAPVSLSSSFVCGFRVLWGYFSALDFDAAPKGA